MGIRKSCVLARGGGATNRRALHLLYGFVTADVTKTAVTSAAPALWAVHGHVVATSQHVPWAEVTKHWGTHLWGSAMSSMTLLGGMDHAVDITGAGRGAPRWWL